MVTKGWYDLNPAEFFEAAQDLDPIQQRSLASLLAARARELVFGEDLADQRQEVLGSLKTAIRRERRLI